MNVSLTAASAFAQSASALPLLHPVLPPGGPTVATVPQNWRESDKRYLFLHNYHGLFLEILPTGSIQGSKETKPVYGVLMLMSYLSSVVIKGYASDLYLCMNNNSEIYASKNYNSSCTFNETILENNWNTYHHSRHKMRKKRFYLGINSDGSVRTGFRTRRHQKMAWFLPLEVPKERLEDATRVKSSGHKGLITTPRPIKHVPLDKRLKEQTRKRRRRWCKKLRKIVRNKDKYLNRCKRDCQILKEMIQNPQRSFRRCLRAQRRRRKRNREMRKQKAQGEPRHRRRHHHGNRRRHRGRHHGKRSQSPRRSRAPTLTPSVTS